MLEVAQVFIKRYESGKLLGFADIRFKLNEEDPGSLLVKGFKIFAGQDGMFVGFPSQKDENGKKDEAGKPVYYPTFVVDREDPDSVGAQFVRYLNTKVEEAFNAEEKPSKKEKKEKTTRKNSGKGEDGCPF